MRAVNTRGKQVSKRLDSVDGEYPHFKTENEEIANWVEEGRAIQADLRAAMHGEIDPRTLDEPPIREWQATGREIGRFINEQLAAIGKWAKERGYSPEEAAAAIGRGEYRPTPPGQ